MAQEVVTYLQMLHPGELRPKRSDDPRFWIKEAIVPQWRLNQFLYQAVGADWVWKDKLPWTAEQWREYVETGKLRTFLAGYDGSPAGYYEIRPDADSGMEIVYFGLMPAFIGRGFGAALLTHAIETCWSANPKRVWLHTCNFDHPVALSNYQARGMKIYKVEQGRDRKV